MSRNRSSAVRFPRVDGMPDERYDVVIMGGGLAGLTLGLQLKQTRPDLSIMIAEKRAGPAPAAAFKVGESTVEQSAYYFADVIGMRDHMEQAQHRKSGLRFFLPANGNEDIATRLEWGPAKWPGVDAFQLDRGLFENELMRRNVLSGVHAFDGCRVEDVELGEDEHRVTVRREDELGADAQATVACHWLVDATGRKFTLKRKLGLFKDSDHHVNSAWLRLAGGLNIEEFSDDPAWLARMEDREIRMSSTNHLMGEGYWIWMIPLASGPISIGIVADPRFHPFERMNTLDAALAWMSEHEPQLFAALDKRRDDVEDFLKVEDFAYNCEKVFSTDRWCIVGEAGAFADPLYSPGSDFIAYGNTWATDLIARELDGENVEERLGLYDLQYGLLFESYLSLYTNQYAHFGNPQVMHAKLTWDFAAYWAVACLRFRNGKLADLDFTKEALPFLIPLRTLAARMDDIYRRWHELSPPEPASGFVSTTTLPYVVDLQTDLEEAVEDDEALQAKIASNFELLQALGVLIFHEAAKSLPEDQRPGEDVTINPLAVSLYPDRWEEDGLFDGSGVSLNAARERVPRLADVLSLEAAVTA